MLKKGIIGLRDYKIDAAMILSVVVLGGLFFCFYFGLLGAEYAQATANDFNNHADTALKALEYVGYGSDGLAAFKEENQYSHVITYPFWHVIVILISWIVKTFFKIQAEEYVMNIAIAFTNSVLLISSYIIIVQYLRKSFGRLSGIFAGMCMMFCGPLDNFGLFDSYYLGAYTANIWHNPTYLAVKPFAIGCFIVYSYILGHDEAEIKHYIKATILLVISAFCKPSFYQFFIPVLVAYCIFHWLLNRTLRTFIHYLKVACTCVPIVFVALIQSTFAISGESGAGMAFGPLYVINHYTDNWLVSILLSIAFPIVVFVLSAIGKRWNVSIELAVWSLVSAFLMYVLFYIKVNPFAADFSWAVGLAINISFLAAVGELQKWTLKNTYEKVLHVLCFVLFGAHVFCGVIYFFNIWQYGSYIGKLLYF